MILNADNSASYSPSELKIPEDKKNLYDKIYDTNYWQWEK